jgi:TatA/E family protein of Tat protein translocase
MFGTLGGPEVILILVVALIVFGPRRLPEIGKSMGKMLAEFRKASNDFKRTIEDELEAEKAKVEAPVVTTTTLEPVVSTSTEEAGASPPAVAAAASAPAVASIAEPVSHDVAAAPVIAPPEAAPRLERPADPVVSRDPATGEK